MSYGSLASVPDTRVPHERTLHPYRELQQTARTCVCHIISGDLWAGAEVQVTTLLKNLVRKEEFDILAVVLNEGRLAAELQACGVEVYIIPESSTGFISIVRQAAQYLRSRPVRILHSHRYKENLLATLLAWRCDIPFVVRTVHGAPEPFRGMRFWRQLGLAKLDRLLARFATDRIISVSEELRDHLIAYVDPGKVRVIRNGLDLSSICSTLSPTEAKAQLGLPEDSVVIGYAGRLEPVKRLDLFLRAARRIADEFPKSRFVIAGDGSQAARLQQLTVDEGLDGRVSFLGHRDDVPDIMRAFDMFLLCSDHEGLPMVLLEALQLGVPVVARHVGGVPEVLGDSVAGVLVNSNEPSLLAETCMRLLRSPQERRNLKERGATRVAEHFSVERTANEVSQIYLSLCTLQ